ncbi:MAG TPA: endonuclease V [Candidatus Caldiarchaeum subterraneum]|uniref:Endonuclease V n=1 Tax=Caldiarchaeum subterraneum TaxID=311458 RepID=A0A833EBW0_CALS0|nr:endonuclease V [Candidatus Caldarchaeum subterraneum]
MVLDVDFIRFFKALQKGVGNIAYHVVNEVEEVRYVAAVDAAYSKNGRIASASLVYDVNEDRIVEERSYITSVSIPYVPGLLFLREGPYMLKTVELLHHRWDLLLVDAHGRAHPRRAGMATFLGICVGKPTLGIAKRLLTGRVAKPDMRVSEIIENGDRIGYSFIDTHGRRFYVSQGFGVSYEAIPDIIKKLGGYPRALTLVDKMSKRLIREKVQ